MTEDKHTSTGSIREQQMAALERATLALRDNVLNTDPELRGDILRAHRAMTCAMLRIQLQELREQRAAAGEAGRLGGLAPAVPTMQEREFVREQARRYSIVIEWSARDHSYVASLPEWEMHGVTYLETIPMSEDLRYVVPLAEWEQQQGLYGRMVGDSAADALRKAEELLELLVERALAHGEPLPEPNGYAGVR